MAAWFSLCLPEGFRAAGVPVTTSLEGGLLVTAVHDDANDLGDGWRPRRDPAPPAEGHGRPLVIAGGRDVADQDAGGRSDDSQWNSGQWDAGDPGTAVSGTPANRIPVASGMPAIPGP